MITIIYGWKLTSEQAERLITETFQSLSVSLVNLEDLIDDMKNPSLEEKYFVVSSHANENKFFMSYLGQFYLGDHILCITKTDADSFDFESKELNISMKSSHTDLCEKYEQQLGQPQFHIFAME